MRLDRELSARRELVAITVVACLVGCDGPGTPEQGSQWRGETLVEGSRTSVTTLSGTVWKAPQLLVEEASIGVREGEDPYMLGTPTSVAAGFGIIVVADSQVPVVRIYDWNGRHIGDAGREGEGPGEYQRPASVGLLPDERIVVRDDRRYAIHIYRRDGTYLDTWASRHYVWSPQELAVTSAGHVYTPAVRVNGGGSRSGMQRVDSTGQVGDLSVPPDFGSPPVRAISRGATGGGIMTPDEFPQTYWTMDVHGSFVAGVSDAYRFEIHGRNGGITAVARADWEPVPISVEEQDAIRARITTWARRRQEDWTWNLPPLPSHKPAYRGLVPSRTGDIWVLRPGPSARISDCEDDSSTSVWTSPCWKESLSYDVFASDGRFLGNVPAPPGLAPRQARPYVDGDTFVAITEDAAGTYYVKRFRLRPAR
jgi:hypothetical protein